MVSARENLKALEDFRCDSAIWTIGTCDMRVLYECVERINSRNGVTKTVPTPLFVTSQGNVVPPEIVFSALIERWVLSTPSPHICVGKENFPFWRPISVRIPTV